MILWFYDLKFIYERTWVKWVDYDFCSKVSILQHIHFLYRIQTHTKHRGPAVTSKHHSFEEEVPSLQPINMSDLAGGLAIMHSSSTPGSAFFKMLVVCRFIPTKGLFFWWVTDKIKSAIRDRIWLKTRCFISPPEYKHYFKKKCLDTRSSEEINIKNIFLKYLFFKLEE